MIIPITLYAGSIPDGHIRNTPLEPALVKKQSQQAADGHLTLTLIREAIQDMAQHYDAWRERFGTEDGALSQRDTILSLRLANVGVLTLSELAESLMAIAEQLQRMPQDNIPLQRNMRIDGEISVKSQYRSSVSFHFVATTQSHTSEESLR